MSAVPADHVGLARAQIIGVPYQLDVGRWGYALGPEALVDAGVAERLSRAGYALDEPRWIELPRAERTRDIVSNLAAIGARTSAAVTAALDAGCLPIVLQGDCSHALGPIGGIARSGQRPGVVWFDAHGDLHTYATTGTGYVGGMPYAAALGWDLDDWRTASGLEPPVDPRAAALIGASDLDPEEVEQLEREPIARLDADALDDTGDRVAALLADRADAATAWYIHVDVDVAGPDEAPGGLTPTAHPPGRTAVLAAIAASARTVPVGVIGIATYNPGGDPTGRGAAFALDCLDAALAGGPR